MRRNWRALVTCRDGSSLGNLRWWYSLRTTTRSWSVFDRKRRARRASARGKRRRVGVYFCHRRRRRQSRGRTDTRTVEVSVDFVVSRSSHTARLPRTISTGPNAKTCSSPLVGGHNMRDLERGRIFMVGPEGHNYTTKKLDSQFIARCDRGA